MTRHSSGRVIIRGIAQGMADRKQVETFLSGSQRILRQILDRLPAYVFWKDRESIYLGCNQRFADFARLPSPNAVIGRTDSDLPWAEEAARLRREDAQIVSTGQSLFGAERQLVHPDGSRCWVRANKVPLRGADGAVGGVLGIFEDISARKLSEDALTQSEARYRAIFEQASDGIVCVDADSLRFVEANHRWLDLLGYSRDDLPHLTFPDIHPGEARSKSLELFRQLRSGAITRAESVPIIRKDGVALCVDLSGVWVAFGENRLFVGFFRDVTDRRRTEQALRESEANLAEAQRIAQLGDWEWDISTGALTWSDEVYRIFGYFPRSFRPRYENEFLHAVHPEDRQRIADILEATRTTGALLKTECRILRPDGTQRAVHMRGEVACDEYGSPTRLIGIIHDITDRRRLEELQRQVRQRVAIVQEQERKRLARELHDEAGQSLSSIDMHLQLLQRLTDSEEIHGHIGELRQMVGHTLDNIHRLVCDLRPSVLDDLGVVAAVEQLVRMTGNSSGIQIDFRAEGIAGLGLPECIASTAYRVIQEALVNVCKHSGAKRASVILERRADRLVILVEDDGQGFILDKQNPDDRGFGLLGIRERASLVGGTAAIESRPGAGTTLALDIPLEVR